MPAGTFLRSAVAITFWLSAALTRRRRGTLADAEETPQASGLGRIARIPRSLAPANARSKRLPWDVNLELAPGPHISLGSASWIPSSLWSCVAQCLFRTPRPFPSIRFARARRPLAHAICILWVSYGSDNYRRVLYSTEHASSQYGCSGGNYCTNHWTRSLDVTMIFVCASASHSPPDVTELMGTNCTSIVDDVRVQYVG
ncbi:hypothetical protein L226DRAFT_261652 [Lentinus tigrinus ALCF2SS1-7]|uniref:Secreted protein n=1 Tax=Lentinus tigrinus ALCF2SS1-6 TaxID=1328759 RepID=A0A5C2RVT5_9APHY|nr:hypothetical protein L227DRAFT_340421 [Lentinus tigrinus ALCF2SS1-6]RPD69884.1 hypothetical protein L226DRAFT_261652 [Lentinus tigrinus ALCF2SS1-7]